MLLLEVLSKCKHLNYPSKIRWSLIVVQRKIADKRTWVVSELHRECQKKKLHSKPSSILRNKGNFLFIINFLIFVFLCVHITILRNFAL